jgi:hypothetical protein
MEDKKDKSDRLKYFKTETNHQIKRKYFYLHQLFEIKELLERNEKEILYNKGWIDFHENSIKRHQEEIGKVLDLNEKINQEGKLNFHKEQIKGHHEKNIEYHNKEIEALQKEIQLFEEGIKRCEEQIEFLNEKIKQNSY